MIRGVGVDRVMRLVAGDGGVDQIAGLGVAGVGVVMLDAGGFNLIMRLDAYEAGVGLVMRLDVVGVGVDLVVRLVQLGSGSILS